MSLGKQYSMPRTAPKTTQAAPSRPQAAPVQGRPSGVSRWLGPLAGLAAGGLLASLFFGDAFEGLQVMDVLLIAALAIGGMMLFRAMRRGQPSPAVAYEGAAGGAGRRAEERFLPPDLGGPVASAVAGEDEAPLWFDGPAFAEAAKTHFIRLQAAWDQSDLRDIGEYTTPQLFTELQRERERLGPAQQDTEVVRLNAELLGVRREGDLAVASVRFTGLIREEEGGGASPFDETWHVQHPWATRDGDWLVAGIQQAEG